MPSSRRVLRGISVAGFKSAGRHGDRYVGDRDRDRTVEGSTPLERFDERGGRSPVGAADGKLELHRVEHGDVCPCLTSTIDDAVHLHGHGPDRDLRVVGDDLDQLHAAGGHGSEEELGRRDFLAGTPVLHRPSDDEVVRAGADEHATEDVGRASSDVIFPDG